MALNQLKQLSVRDASLNLRCENISVKSISIDGTPFDPTANNWETRNAILKIQSSSGGAQIGSMALTFFTRAYNPLIPQANQVNMWATTATITPTASSNTLYFDVDMNTGFVFPKPNSPTGIPVLITEHPTNSPPTTFIKGVMFFNSSSDTGVGSVIHLDSALVSGTSYSLQSVFCNYVGLD